MNQTLHLPQGPELPLVFDSPHSGHGLPADMRPAAPPEALATSWDAFVEELFGHAPACGATLLEAHFPRCYIDANRSRRDIDPALLDAPWPGDILPGPKSAAGMGLIRRFALPGVPVYDRLLTVDEVTRRIERCYDPYHAALRGRLDALHGQFGTVWHVDCHSMKSRGNAMNDDPGQLRPDFVVSDRDGTTAEPAFTQQGAALLAGLGYRVSVNAPYKGAELVAAFGAPAAGYHSIQIEVNRGLYMDEQAFARGPGFGKLRADMDRFVSGLAEWVAGRAGTAAA